MEIDKPTTIVCTVVAIDHANLYYRLCSVCEKTLPDDPRMSIATDTNVFTVIMFDRAARVLFGCSGDEYFDFAKTHPYAEMAADSWREKC